MYEIAAVWLIERDTILIVLNQVLIKNDLLFN